MLDTVALQAAIDACAAHGGGTVVIPARRYQTGALYFRDNITLHIEAGAVLLGSQNPTDYPLSPYRWEGAEQVARAPRENPGPPHPRLIGFTDCEKPWPCRRGF